MRKFLAIIAILLPLSAPAVQGNSDIPSGVNSRTAPYGAVLMTNAEASHNLPIVNSLQSQVTLRLAAADKNGDSGDKNVKKPESAPGTDVDLRYVDWDKVKAGKKVGNGAGDKGDNGDGNKESVEGKDDTGGKKFDNEDVEEQEKDDEKKDEGGGGFDRLWDVPKLG
jgi:hypothetical protein